ncbi:MAG: hypothetical protein JOZ92_05625, partial [Candidatus Dormibacteraeota bacterium]|nr:hypothetical protein [Candidatus Dormibacteraeota bacterium]
FFVSIGVPLCYAALAEWLQQPSRYRLLMLGALGIAVTGLGPTATLLVPGIALAALAPAVLRRQWTLFGGGLLVLAGPVGAGIVEHFTGTLSPTVALPSDLDAMNTLLRVAGSGVLAGISIAALFGGWIGAGRIWARVTAAVASALAALVLAPHALPELNQLTGAGTVLWRLMWLVPVAPAVGALAVLPLQLRALPRAAGAAFAALLGLLMVLTGTPIWSATNSATLVGSPGWKIEPQTLSAARSVVSMAGVGDIVLAPADVSGAMAILTTRVRAVDPRSFYLIDYEKDPGFDSTDREVLDNFEDDPSSESSSAVAAALRAFNVRLACVAGGSPGVTVLQGLGYTAAGAAGSDTCLRSG